MIVWHKHHIVPKHAGGTDEPSNLLKCNIAMHSFMHEQRYRETGDVYDKIAAAALKGQIPHAEASKQARIEAAKRWRDENREEWAEMQRHAGSHPKPDKEGRYSAAAKVRWADPEDRKKRSEAMRGKREIVTCPHCGVKGGGGNMRRYHFDKCKKMED